MPMEVLAVMTTHTNMATCARIILGGHFRYNTKYLMFDISFMPMGVVALVSYLAYILDSS